MRGMHWQQAPHGENKLVRCTSGAIFDVCVDLRAHSPTYLKWVGMELTAANRIAVYVPEGCAHGFLTLSDHAEVLYQMSTPHVSEAERGFRWNDSAVAIAWPEKVLIASERDRGFPDLKVVG